MYDFRVDEQVDGALAKSSDEGFHVEGTYDYSTDLTLPKSWVTWCTFVVIHWLHQILLILSILGYRRVKTVCTTILQTWTMYIKKKFWILTFRYGKKNSHINKIKDKY